MKKTIRLTESDLHRIVKESVKRTLNEARAGDIKINDIKGIEQSIINAYQAQQELMYCDLPREAVEAAQEGDRIDLHEEWWRISQYLAQALRHMKSIKYYMGIPTNHDGSDFDLRQPDGYPYPS